MPNEHIPSDLHASLVAHVDLARRLGSETSELLAVTRETMAQSRALIAEVAIVLARVAFGTALSVAGVLIAARRDSNTIATAAAIMGSIES